MEEKKASQKSSIFGILALAGVVVVIWLGSYLYYQSLPVYKASYYIADMTTHDFPKAVMVLEFGMYQNHNIIKTQDLESGQIRNFVMNNTHGTIPYFSQKVILEDIQFNVVCGLKIWMKNGTMIEKSADDNSGNYILNYTNSKYDVCTMKTLHYFNKIRVEEI